ncbi:hypothetical protein evm_004822 [Chilo suppressalis]|nr:hypothetical protein evm_004822 [Chilo suppressalis]
MANPGFKSWYGWSDVIPGVALFRTLQDNEKSIPPVPLKTYQWEDLRRAREAGGYPWTHFLKEPIEGEITAEDIIRETTPRRSMSREFSKSRTHSPVDRDVQKILILDSSPGSSRKHGEEGEDEGVHIPNFSKEVSLDSEDDNISKAAQAYIIKRPESQTSTRLATPIEIPKNVSPKGILKRRVPEQQYNIGVTETREKTKCCHPLVNKIKHLADKTLHKLDKTENGKSPVAKRKKNEEAQEIRQLRSSPGAVRRQKFSAIKLGDSDEMSKSLSVNTPPPRKKKEHIYEDVGESKNAEVEKSLHFSPDVDKYDLEKSDDNKSNSNKENESILEKKSVSSFDPSLVADDAASLKPEEHIMEKLHKKSDVNKEAILLDDEMDADEPNVDEIFQNQLDESRSRNESPNITITEIIDEDIEVTIEQTTTIPIESSPSPSPLGKKNQFTEDVPEKEWSKPSSDHEYEIIEKPLPNIVYSTSVEEKPTLVKAEDELSSTTSLERKFLQHTTDEEDHTEEEKENQDDKTDDILIAEALQKNIEDRFFANTPSTVSRTECEVSTSQVDSSALENLPLKRDSRQKNPDNADSKIQQRIKESTGKLKTQAGKLKTKLQNIKVNKFSMPDRPKINFPDRPKFKMPERPKISFPERPRFNMPEGRKFSLPDRPKFKKINLSGKLSLGDRKKFTLPDRPKFNVPDLPKFKMPERPKISFPSLGRKKDYKVEDMEAEENRSDSPHVATVDFESKTFPRLFNRKKKTEIPKTSSSPTLNRDETPPPTFTFTRVKKTNVEPSSYTTESSGSQEQPREYGNIENEEVFENEPNTRRRFETTYDFDKMDPEYLDEEMESSNFNENRNASSIPNISPSNQEYTHINEINNDEFFVRPRGISRENIQVREYLSDEIRQAFKIPNNVLASMGSNSGVNDEHLYYNEPEADPELMIDDNEHIRYSNEDLNDKDDGYYTFPPVRPSRAKRKKKAPESIKYIDDSVNASIQFSEVDLELPEHQHGVEHIVEDMGDEIREENGNFNTLDFSPSIDLHSIHEYANDDVIEYPENLPIQSQTLPMPPKRKKKFVNKDIKHSSLNDFKKMPLSELWEEPQSRPEDIIVYRTEHEYVVPQVDTVLTGQSPVPPRRNRSRSSRGTSLCDDDRTSHGAESLTLDTHMPQTEDIELVREIRHESPGYATVDKGPNAPAKPERRSISKTPPVRRRKSNSSERKYYTVGSTKNVPDRPPRKKSSTSLMTLDSFAKRSVSGDLTQYVEIDEPQIEEVHKDLKSGEIVSKMKDRPLPPPPRPPRVPKRKKNEVSVENQVVTDLNTTSEVPLHTISPMEEEAKTEEVIEIEVSTQTDPLPDDVDYELGMDDNLDISMSSSLRDIVDDESIIGKSMGRMAESPRVSRPTSRSEKSLKLSDPKISDLAKTSIGRTSPTVILVERRVSSPTRINDREEILTEASLTVQHIDIDESQIPDVPPLPKSKGISSPIQKSKVMTPPIEERALERVRDTNRDVQLDNLVTQRLQVRDLDVGRLNVSELQASKILVSDIEGMTLQVTELDSKSGHISVSGIEFSQSVIDEIVKKFAEITTTNQTPAQSSEPIEVTRPVSREEHTQTDQPAEIPKEPKEEEIPVSVEEAPPPPPRPEPESAGTPPPQRPPPPDLTPLLYSYLQDINMPSATFFPPRAFRERPFTDYHDPQHQTPPPQVRRPKRKPAAPHSESSSDDNKPRPSPRRMPPPVRTHEPSIGEAGAQFLRVCQTSISRVFRNMFNSLMSYISGTEDKKDVQMALVIFLVLVAGLIMFGLSDSRTIHHHHWEFFNPPDSKP